MMHDLYTWLDWTLGLSLKSHEIGFGQAAARAAVMYLALIVILRSGKKRALGGATVFDVVLVIVLGSIGARAIVGDAPFFPSMLALVVLAILHWLFARMARDSPLISHWIKGGSSLLIKDGHVDWAVLKREHMSRDDLDQDLRERKVASVSQVAEARLERNGKLSVIQKGQS